jgi:DNA-binding CsgD family transcriptional regulator
MKLLDFPNFGRSRSFVTLPWLIPLFLSVFSVSSCGESGQDVGLEKDFEQLDSVVANRSQFINHKEWDISNLKKEILSCTTPSDKYVYSKRLFDEYMKFNPDSAFFYSSMTQKYALEGGMHPEYLQAKIDALLLTILSGDYYKAKIAIDKMGPIESFPKFARPKLAMAYLEFYMRRQYISGGKTVDNSNMSRNECWKAYGKYLNPGDWVYDYYKNCILRCNNRNHLLRDFSKVQEPSIVAAMLAYAIAVTYEDEGKEEMYYHWLIRSATNDVVSVNRETQSLITLVRTPLVNKNSSRAFNYLMVCTDNAYYYKDYGRSLAILNAHQAITKSAVNSLRHKNALLMWIVALLSLSAVVITVLLYVIISRRRHLAMALSKMEDMNQQLHTVVNQKNAIEQQLKQNNIQLKKDIDYRNSNFIDVYKLVSEYISVVKNFRKSIFNLITAGKVEKVRKELASDNAEEKYLHQFYVQFDKAFLSSHPDFLQRFNVLLKPDNQQSLTEDGGLTPELRIYALISIGITDSISIAQFLHYSPQTIYNYRLKMRLRAVVGKKEFSDSVVRLYEKK